MNTYSIAISQKAIVLPKSPQINLRIFWSLSLVVIFALLIFFIFQVNVVISEGYQIQNYEKKLKRLSQEREILELNSNQANFLGNIENLIKNLNFVEVGRVNYIRLIESQIVTK